MSYDPSQPRDEQGQWTNLSDIPDPSRTEGTIRVQLSSGETGEYLGHTPEVNYGAFKEPAHFHVQKDTGARVAVHDAKIIEHIK